jgi:mono/diheme cytochrome c family protein
MKTIINTLFILLTAISFAACSGGGDERPSSTAQPTAPEFSAFELEHGIGPVTEVVELGDLNEELAAKGKDIFLMKCDACHNMDSRMVGPALGEVLDRRTATFVMNFILNPSGMARQHPEGKKLLAEYMTPMPFQNVSTEEARAIVEYLRTQNSD